MYDDKTSALQFFPLFFLLNTVIIPGTHSIFIFNISSLYSVVAFCYVGTRSQNAYSPELFGVPTAITLALRVQYSGTQKEIRALTSY